MYGLITDYLGRILQSLANYINFTATGGEAIRAFHWINFLNFQKLPIRATLIYSVPLLFTAILRDKNASDGWEPGLSILIEATLHFFPHQH
jgi:hypothetical protein